jgi:diacylglycerol kinase (ATP)
MDTLRVGVRTVVAVNARASRLRDPEAVLQAILAATDGSGADVSGVVTEGEDDLLEAIDAANGGRLVLAGGDGSVHFALNAAPGPIEIGLIPMGTANNIARALGLPRDVPRAARRAVLGHARPVDVLRVETPDRALYGVEGLSAGLQADARMRYDSVDSGHLLEGASAFASAFGRYAPWTFELELDGVRAFEGRAAELFLSNFPLFAYGFKVDPIADVGDGRLEAVLLEAESRPRVARLVLAAYRGTLDRQRNVTITPAREAVLKSPVPLVCDSEVLGTTTAAVRVEQGRLKIAA